MALIDRFMPVSSSLREVHHFAVAASPVRAWEAVRAVDLYRIGFVRRLFALRAAPDAALARLRGKPSPLPSTARIDELTRDGTPGFRILAEATGREIVVGAIGKVWRPHIRFLDVPRERFAGFDDPGWAKVAWSLAVAPASDGGAWITIDVRAGTTDETSRRSFARYWRLIGPFSRAIRRALARVLAEDLGEAAPDEARVLAGDELLPADGPEITDAIDVEAPPARLWPWLLQLGCRRGGWYSWDLLDNGGVPSARTIEPALQRLAVGDIVPARPTGDDGFAVIELAPERALVLGSPSLLPRIARPDAAHPIAWRSTWAFVLEPIGDDATHLVVRVRGDFPPGLASRLLRTGLGAVHEMMEWKQLRTLKQRAEQPPSHANVV